MASLKRWVARLLGLAVLVAAGWFAHDYARSRPRCVIVSDTHAVHFSGAELTLNIGTSDGVELSGDGSTLVCFEYSDTGAPVYRFRFHDLRSHRPWYWAAAAPTALLVLWLLARTWGGGDGNDHP